MQRYVGSWSTSRHGADIVSVLLQHSSRLASAQQVRQLGDVGGDALGLVAGELDPLQRLPAHGEEMLAYKAEQRLGTGETMRRREFIALMGATCRIFASMKAVLSRSSG